MMTLCADLVVYNGLSQAVCFEALNPQLTANSTMLVPSKNRIHLKLLMGVDPN